MADKTFLVRHGLTVGDNLLVVANTGKVSVGSSSANVSFEVIATDAIMMPSGNTGQRPTGINGYFRYNNQTHVVEAYINGSWGPIGGTAVAANVSGPVSSTNNAIALFDGTNGALLKNSLVSIATTGKVTTVAANTTTAGLNLPHGTAPSSAVNGDIWTTGTELSYRLSSTNYNVMPKSGGTFTSTVITDGSVTGSTVMANTTGSLGQLEVRNNGVGAAMMTFHRTGSFAGYFGLDTDNNWKVGGYSYGNASYKVWHEGLFTPVNKAGDSLSGNLTFGLSKLDVSSGDIWSTRASANTTGVIYLGSTGNRYLYYDGTKYVMAGAELQVNGSTVWHAGNITPLSNTGGTMSGVLNLYPSSKFLAEGGNEGGQFLLAKPASGTSITHDIIVDVQTNYLRVFESGGSLRGFLVDITGCGAGVGSTLWHTGNDGSGSGLDADTVDGSHASAFFPVAGGTVTGNITINKASPTYVLSKTASGQHAGIQGYLNSTTRWFIALGDDVSESGSNAGSNFAIFNYNDAGTFIGTPFYINRATSVVTLNGGTAWSSGNDGAGSGLDADTVDGLHASSFASINDQTSSSSTTFPIGTVLLAEHSSVSPATLNSTVTVTLNTGFYWVNSGSGTTLTGTWRVCGVNNDATSGNDAGFITLVQRVA